MQAGPFFVIVAPLLGCLVASLVARLPEGRVIGALAGMAAGSTVITGLWWLFVATASAP